MTEQQPVGALPRPTLESVAERAGVSRATASRVVNGGEGVRESLRARVQQAVDELGYVPNLAARTLVTRRNGAVAVVVAEPESRLFSDPFFAQHLRGISRELSAADNQMVLLLVEDQHDYERVGRYLAGGHVDGALLFSLHHSDPLPEMARRVGLPTVIGGRPGWPGAEADRELVYVDSDNRGGARLAVQHLRSLGRTRIATITGPLDQTSSIDRLDGYRDLLPDGDPELIAEGDFTADGGGRAMARLLARRPALDAVFAASDAMASGALRVLREAGRRVPEDVAMVGFDDVESIAAWTDPPLTTVRQDIEEMGRLMARLLLRRLAGPGGPGPTSIIIPTTLVRRASA
ncbi:MULTISPECIES: LacI family DNA-binding transcriptional regulator [Streptomycetaceae]|uniref:LacI family transcriptional regulator n=1 Tax=Kitasatospora herbaricolor TaxID=68217 RepID=A0ABZ1WF94_9ACTN|nr:MULTISPECIES: LacI family DNA-binding transcriptional regulator [Streptomycetaceae]MDQ0307632.1 DNA-binding LacI/PurR family transcriptional regulator [Kitasatospora herbaricolor]OKI30105.1 LacI family transcriptional regulator [Streptomyces sp. CB03911]GGV16169.1 LacI family transcriptional regulator [Kitasatospora herbaricolor]